MSHPDLEAVFREYSDFVFRICLRYTRERTEAEDLTQEIFFSLPRRLAGFRGESKLGTWLYRIAANRCLDHLRMKVRRKELDLAYLDERVIVNLSPSGDRVLAKIDLERILFRIGTRNRQILFLTLAEGLSYQEAADTCGMKKDAVAKIVTRFLAKTRGSGARKAAAVPCPAPGLPYFQKEGEHAV